MSTENAKLLLSHYFQMLFEKVGLPWGENNQVDVETIVDEILEAAEERAEEIAERVE